MNLLWTSIPEHLIPVFAAKVTPETEAAVLGIWEAMPTPANVDINGVGIKCSARRMLSGC